MVKKPNRRSKTMSLYANLAARRKSKIDAKARRKAEYLATLPKHPLKRLAYRLHPKRVAKFWFSKQGAITFAKLMGVGLIIIAIFIAALFAYYRRELDAIRPEELAKRVQTTVSKYVDRNGVLLWDDKGDDAYKLVIQSGEINNVMKQATVAVEDRDFYTHGGISVTGLIRAGLNNAAGSGNVQGASTLTQQLIKQVFFANEAAANRLDISRKVKEIILAIEVERMYNKDQILTLYLNESPYGGRRNGVESASLTYFGKHAKDLSLPEAALLAAIPQNPTYYNPYNTDGNKDLIERQHKVLNDMREQGYINKDQADEAKKVPILDTIKPELTATEDIKAPHFVLEVRSQLEKEFGTKLVRDGGLTIKTTLDSRIQQKAEESVTKNYRFATAIGATNMAVTAVDVPTGQVLAMVGSYDYNNKQFGEVNAATALLNPGSSIKPFIYANLFKPKEGLNYGAGTILSDENIDKQYGSQLRNYDGKFMGNIAIRQGLGNSRNPPAVKAAIAGGLNNAIKTTQEVGNRSYCVGVDYGLSAAIGSCAVRQVEHVNSYATLARQGNYEPESYILEVKNAQGQVIKQWKSESKRVLDPQITYMLSDVLTDPAARSSVFGPNPPGFNVPGVKTATKTGTTDDGAGHAKDSWMMSYTPRMALGIWTGRNDPKALTSLSSTGNANVIMDVQKFAHQEVFAKDGSWKAGDWFQQPAGIQKLTVAGKTDIFPSWYVKPTTSEQDMVFDQLSKRKATQCTPARAKVTLKVQSFQDPVTKVTTTTAPDGYDTKNDDDRHNCSDVKPFVTVSATQSGSGANKVLKISANVTQGSFPLSSIDIAVDGQVVSSQAVGGAGTYTYDYPIPAGKTSANVSATVVDQGFYDGSDSTNKTITSTGGGNNNFAIVKPPRRD
ncbi:MAG TPA: transglycosylase domain-containing protein [Candidatus Saccharimonadales bacterium]|nr:transglycosylase domain-containing protein [Candidatus Saccharimonadales bacterium]